MSLAFRIIPKLDIKGPNLVKGMHLEGLRVLGKPEFFANYYYNEGADELIYQDVVASLYGRNSLHDIISRTAKEIFIPLTVGGGIRNLKDISDVLRAGADKVCLNTSAHENPKIISESSRMYGRSTIVISIEAIRQTDGSYMAFTDNGRNQTGSEVVAWAKKVEELGAGEILLTSVDKEGTGEGIDHNLISKVCKSVNIPVVAHGGIGRPKDVEKVASELSVSGVAISSILHYQAINFSDKNANFEDEGNIEFLKNTRSISSINTSRIKDIKKLLKENYIQIR